MIYIYIKTPFIKLVISILRKQSAGMTVYPFKNSNHHTINKAAISIALPVIRVRIDVMDVSCGR